MCHLGGRWPYICARGLTEGVTLSSSMCLIHVYGQFTYGGGEGLQWHSTKHGSDALRNSCVSPSVSPLDRLLTAIVLSFQLVINYVDLYRMGTPSQN